MKELTLQFFYEAMQQQFGKMDQQFEQVDKRFDALEKKVDEIDTKIDTKIDELAFATKKGFDDTYTRLDRIEFRFDRHEREGSAARHVTNARLDRIETHLGLS